MVMDWTTLLVPLDGSPHSEAALPYAEAIAEATGASLHLLSVVEREPGVPITLWDMRPAEAAQRAVEEEQTRRRVRTRYLADQAAELRARGLVVATAVTLGEPVDAILAAASQ